MVGRAFEARHDRAVDACIGRRAGDDLVEQLGPDAHPARLVTLDSEDITSLLDLVEATDTVFFGIFACARARIAAGRVCEIHVQPHFERFGQYALVTLARRSMSPAVEVFRAFFAENFGE